MKKRKYFLWFFGKTKSFPYVPARDQNHIVRGKKPSDLFPVFLLFFEKVFKIKAKWQRRNLFGIY